MSGRIVAPCALGVFLLAASGVAGAGDLDFGNGLEAEYKLTLNYSLSMRTRAPAEALINGPVDPFQSQAGENGQLVGFTHSGLSTTVNFDDGDRNFKKHALTHNRLTAYGELNVRSENYGLILAGDIFYDDVYAQRGRKNDNTSPETVNKDPPHDEFTAEARKYDGQRARLLDAYMYGDLEFGEDSTLNLRLGQQVIAWGESLFLYGIALTQGRADATRAYVPGAEIKEILLPTNQFGFRLSPGGGLTLLGYYKLDFKATEIFPVGDFLSIQDLVGPGGTFARGSLNPAYGDGCPGLLLIPGLGVDLSSGCEADGLGGPAFGAKPFIDVPRGPDIEPRRNGQWGLGATYPFGPVALGLYYLRYHSSTPFVKLNMGYAQVTTRPPLTTETFDQTVPTSYQVGNADGIHLAGASFSTVLGPFNIAGELLYRENVDTSVQAIISGVLSPVSTRGTIYQALVSGLLVTNPNFWYDEFVFVWEAGFVHVEKVTPFPAEPGIIPVGDGEKLFYDRDSTGYQTLFLLTKRNIFDGWDFKTTATWGEIVNGTPSLTAAFGGLYGEGDQRASIGFGLQYVQNLEFGLSYNKFLGDPNANIGESTLKANPYSDRDYVALNIKYNL